MKKIIAIVFCTLLFVACTKRPDDPIIPDPPATITHSVTAAALGTGGSIDPNGLTIVKDGGSVTLKILTDKDHSIRYIKKNGVDITITDILEFSNIKGDLDIKTGFIYKDAVTLSTGTHWFLTALNYYTNDGKLLSESVLQPQEKLDDYEFTVDGATKVNGIYSCSWTISSPGCITIGDQNYTYTLTDKKFVRSNPATYANQPAVSVAILERK